MTKWIEGKLRDLVEVNPTVKLIKGERYPFVSMDVIQPFYKPVEAKEEREFRSGGAKFENGDILFARITPCLENGKIAQVKNLKNGKGFGSTEFIVLRGKEGVTDTDFVYYLATNKAFRENAERLMVGTSGRQRVDKQQFEDQIISIPDLETQKRISSILGSIDKKIELNVEMNKTLEETAMTLYKHWFVDFGPFQDGEFVESELGMIPEGWECIEIGEAVSVLGGGTPKTSVKEYWENGDINWFSPTDLTTQKSLFISKSSKKITKLGLEKSSAKLFPPYCVMMTSRATIGEISINKEEACTNQGFITLIPNETFTMYQLYFWLKTNIDLILSIANGSTFKEVSKTNFKKLKILKPKNIEEFTRKCEMLFKLIESNLIEIEELTNIRDYLLPRLLSGEIDVSQAQKQVEVVL
ncbi:restriction endonuclease subunit S [Caenibacillus caldisaponilyticus]|uniref:restriction endonuclease subunit S n=1 Tax=Caenibacillus caldisaponilyticus TaxID=1674942 RepID=UPI0009884D54|nr:restriction endonuclease subunit S [Caenibacillus caldisaponilyticus]